MDQQPSDSFLKDAGKAAAGGAGRAIGSLIGSGLAGGVIGAIAGWMFSGSTMALIGLVGGGVAGVGLWLAVFFILNS